MKSLDSDKNKKIEAYTKLIEKILEIEKMDWLVFSNYNKEKGLELLPKEQFNFNITEERFKEVKKYTVIRFNGKYSKFLRLIKYKIKKVTKSIYCQNLRCLVPSKL